MARHQNYNRQLRSQLQSIEFDEWRQKVVNERTSLLLHSEHTVLTQRRTKDLNDLNIPEWRHTDVCKCAINSRTCPKHWRSAEVAKQAKIKDKHIYALKTPSEEELYHSYPITRFPMPKRKQLPIKTVSYLS